MSCVLDASVAVAYVIPDENLARVEAVIERLRDMPAEVPTLWSYEVASACRAAERSGRIGADDAAHLIRLVTALPVRAHEVVPAHLLDIARACSISVYDAAYVSLALTLNLPLATLDTRLAEAARASGVTVIG